MLSAVASHVNSCALRGPARRNDARRSGYGHNLIIASANASSPSPPHNDGSIPNHFLRSRLLKNHKWGTTRQGFQWLQTKPLISRRLNT
jgi:hypothetical protein